jgi:hypothetical protein
MAGAVGQYSTAEMNETHLGAFRPIITVVVLDGAVLDPLVCNLA